MTAKTIQVVGGHEAGTAAVVGFVRLLVTGGTLLDFFFAQVLVTSQTGTGEGDSDHPMHGD